MKHKFIRAWFKKDNESRFLSHLDVNKCMIRALSASGLPFWFTEGFNPHLFMTFLSPLAVGIFGKRECFDVKLPIDLEINSVIRKIDNINDFLPSGLEILNFSTPEMRFSDLCYSKYDLKIIGITNVDSLEKFFSQQVVSTEKKTKSTVKTVNLKKNIKNCELATNESGYIFVKLIITSGNLDNVNPFLLVDCIKDYIKQKFFCEITRICTLDKNLQLFR